MIIYKSIGGSRLYGLNSELSDYDYRGVFLNEDISKIIGLDRYEHESNKSVIEDSFYYELRHFLNLCRKTNTQCIEMLYNTTNIIITSPIFNIIQSNKEKLIDSDKLFKSLIGYMYGELRLANGERTGDLGKQRRNSIEKYGFSPKNWCNLLRLAHSGAYFYQKGILPANFSSYLPEISDYLLKVKNTPELFTKEELQVKYDEAYKFFEESYKTTNIKFKFDIKLANDIITIAYKKYIDDYYNKIIL